MKKLKRGSTIGVCSPSFNGKKHYKKRYKRGILYLKDKGFNILEIDNSQNQNDLTNISDISQRVKELNFMFSNSDCVITSIGGYNSNSLLPYIDYNIIKEKKPIFIGFSDTTAISLAIYAKTGIPTFMSQSIINSFGEFPPYNQKNFKYFEDILINDYNVYNYIMPSIWTDDWINWETFERDKINKSNEWIVLNNGKAEGKIIAGNLDTIIGIIGTPYMPKIPKGTILVLDEVIESFERFERNLTTLKLHGVFKKISGLIISKFEQLEKYGNIDDIKKILLATLENINIPILLEFDCGHTHPSFILPIGEKGILNLSNSDVTFKFTNTIFHKD